MRPAIVERQEELGFSIDRRRSRRHQAMVITDSDFAEGIAITTEEIHQAQKMLASVEREAAKIGLYLKSKKTEVVHFNQGVGITIKAKNGESPKGLGMVSLSRVEAIMKIRFKKRHQGAAFHGLCRIYPDLWKRDMGSHESYGEETRWMLYQNVTYGI